MLLVVCDGACWPFTCVMVVGEGCFGWCVFQWCVAVVCASRRVPGVGVCVCVLVCSGVGWLVCGVCGVKACVAGLVCVSWFRMLMRVLLSVFFVLLSWFCLFVWLITLPGRVGLVGVCLLGCCVAVLVVWCGVRGVLFGVACCPRGWAMLLLVVVWVFRLVWVRGCLCSVV